MAACCFLCMSSLHFLFTEFFFFQMGRRLHRCFLSLRTVSSLSFLVRLAFPCPSPLSSVLLLFFAGKAIVGISPLFFIHILLSVVLLKTHRRRTTTTTLAPFTAWLLLLNELPRRGSNPIPLCRDQERSEDQRTRTGQPKQNERGTCGSTWNQNHKEKRKKMSGCVQSFLHRYPQSVECGTTHSRSCFFAQEEILCTSRSFECGPTMYPRRGTKTRGTDSENSNTWSVQPAWSRLPTDPQLMAGR